jgi:hypothetical protein
MYPVCRWYRRKWVRHPDLVRSRIQYERVGVVQLTPACPYVGLVPEFSSSRRTTKLDEGCVGAVTKIQQFGVDRPTLPRPCIDANDRPVGFVGGLSGVRKSPIAGRISPLMK